MKRAAFLLVVAVCLVATAGAVDFTLFWSLTGISDPNLRYSSALTNFQPAYQPPTPVTVVMPGTVDVFLWGTFPTGWENYQIYGLDLKWGAGNTAEHAENVAYRHKWGNQSYAKRWDGSASIPLDGVMAAVTASGIIWDTVTPAYRLMEPDGRFLIGAARVTGDPGELAVVALDPPTDGLGLGFAARDPNGNPIMPPLPNFIPAQLLFYPEPASVLLLISVVLLARRR